MTPAQPLLPFFPTFAALERAAKPGAADGCEVLELQRGETQDDDEVTIARHELRVPRAPQLPRPQLFGSARGSSPDLRRRR